MNSRPAPFDELDRKIVTALMANARTSFAEIGAAIGLSATAVKRRVDRLRGPG
ncbi:AsnC family transcriptional regulator OS=Streptomyces glaucescens OX=1907 GN=SGLAU_04880 PE=4 SV=1 [Streptomyces glaucescens]